MTPTDVLLLAVAVAIELIAGLIMATWAARRLDAREGGQEMNALRRWWAGWPGAALVVVAFAALVAAYVASATCGRDPAPLGTPGTLDAAGRFPPAGEGP